MGAGLEPDGGDHRRRRRRLRARALHPAPRRSGGVALEELRLPAEWVWAQAALGLPLLAWILLRRGTARDPVPRGDPPKDARGVLAAIALFAGAILLSLVLLLALGAGAAPPLEELLLADAAGKLAAVALLALLLSRIPGPGPAPTPAPLRPALRAGILSGLAFLPLGIGVLFLQQWIYPRFDLKVEAQPLVLQALRGDATVFLLVCLIAVVVAPLFEEMLFRVHLYSGLRVFLGPAACSLLTAALFAASHPRDAIPVTFLLGLCLADLRERTGGRTAPIAMHACYNAFQVGGMLLLRLGGTPGGG